jgi:hypothetical protein
MAFSAKPPPQLNLVVRWHDTAVSELALEGVLMMKTIADFAPDGTEAGVGLALQDDNGHYLLNRQEAYWCFSAC